MFTPTLPIQKDQPSTAFKTDLPGFIEPILTRPSPLATAVFRPHLSPHLPNTQIPLLKSKTQTNDHRHVLRPARS